MMSEFNGYVALPPTGTGPGVLVLHAWWGLNDFFRRLCDRLAAEGFVAVAPDLYGDGRVTTTVADAQAHLDAVEGAAMRAAVLSGIDYLVAHPAVRGERLGVVGFSLGAAWSIAASLARPEQIAAVTLFYGSAPADFSTAHAAYLGHFAPGDPWEPDEGVTGMESAMRAAGRDVTLCWYPGAGHWFFEDDRPDAYVDDAATLAWERTIAFFRQHLE
jgi:carboxymethylenebutenolidase